jgi:Flp pilus assembly protein TadD
VEQQRADLDMLARLEQIRLGQPADRDMAARLDAIRLDRTQADRTYQQAFRDYGLDLDALPPDKAAARIRASAISERLVAGLDDWVLTRWGGGQDSARLLAVARQADPDPWRSRLRVAFEQRDWKALKRLAQVDGGQDQPPATLVFLATLLRHAGEVPLAIEVLRQAQRRHPHDFWITHQLALALTQLEPARTDEALGYYRAALALRPTEPGVYLNLGNALRKQGRLAEAVAAFRQAIRLNPEVATSYVQLALALMANGDLDGAIAAYQHAVRLAPKDPVVREGLLRAEAKKRRQEEQAKRK